EIIKIQYDELDDDLLKKYINVLNDSANNQFKLLIDLLQWARSQNGNMSFKPKDIQLAGLIAQEMMLYKDNLDEKNITIKNCIMPDLYVHADYDMLCTVFRNLISNAMKFSYSGGIIEILSQKNTTKVNIAIKDYGMGMDEQQLENLFRLENRCSTPGTQMERGTGLGLLLCKEFIEKHGESFTVKSEPRKGTSFSFNLQLSKPSVHS
ncbi:MAG: HAMP domain-containing sensor histidine kinase, partial [Bacteroidota bacterium]|nr:HAMP domain-containing sensor histidine kinase [Bacteroidota bacterium]